MNPDYLIVGSGLTGAVIARTLTDANFSVIVLERREHLGGNVYDEVHPSGIRVHRYGPHSFRTSSRKIWEFVGRFANFYPFELRIMSVIDGNLEHWPVQTEFIERLLGVGWTPSFTGKPSNFEEAVLAKMPLETYQHFVKGYTEKQWGVPAKQLGVDLAKRVSVRNSSDPRLKQSKYQGLPIGGYAAMMKRMLEGIEVRCETDFLENRQLIQPQRKCIYTGPIDAYFEYKLGRLEYRGQERTHIFFEDTDYKFPTPIINHPHLKTGEHIGLTNTAKADQALDICEILKCEAYIRSIEWKHFMEYEIASQIKGSLLTHEKPISPKSEDRFEYPFPNQANRKLYKRYRELADKLDDVLICGRLGEYRYYDMDQAIGRALMISTKLLREALETDSENLADLDEIRQTTDLLFDETDEKTYQDFAPPASQK